MRVSLLPLAALLAACIPESTVLAPRCDLTLGEPSPSAAAPGDAVVLTGAPLTSSYDTAVYVGAARATVVEVSRDGCDACDTCREQAECSVCGDCDACDQECGETCSETITFEVPATGDGEWPVTVYNTHGVGGPVALQVLGGGADTGADGGAGDSGDGGASDGGASDGGASDGGAGDGGAGDGGAGDGGAGDGGAGDGGASDGGAGDGGDAPG